LCLTLGALAAVATMTMAAIAYATTRHRLQAEVDRSVAVRLERPLGGLRAAGRRIPNGILEELIASDTRLQIIGVSGDVQAWTGPVPLPVDATDRLLAGGGSAAGVRLRTVDVEGEPFRIGTRAVPGIGAVQVARSLDETDRVLASLRRQFGLVVGAVVVGAAALGYLIARRSARSLERLTAAAEEVAMRGSPAVPIDPSAYGRDETGRLAGAMATMLDALAQSQRQQRDLVQDAGHELRTPITSLRTNLDVLARHPDLDPARRDTVVAELRGELIELGTLVDELVAAATDPSEAGAEQPRVVSLDAVVRQVAGRVGRRHGRLVTVDGTGAAVLAPPVGLARAVGNLLENAVKFSPDGSAVSVRLDGGRVAVSDAGGGIDPADADRVWDRFYRSAGSRTLPGSGLGLAIVRQVVTGAGGEVFVVPRRADGVNGPPPAVGFVLPTVP
jgi:two-component system sensor histidine kinase MprB